MSGVRSYSCIPKKFKRRVASFINVQTVVESNGNFTWYLPCLSTEASCDASVSDIVSPPTAGNNVVRAGDGLHFCPLVPQTSNLYYDFVNCDAYSSGTIRHAAYIAAAVDEFQTKNWGSPQTVEASTKEK
jgi:hypothetical protein